VNAIAAATNAIAEAVFVPVQAMMSPATPVMSEARTALPPIVRIRSVCSMALPPEGRIRPPDGSPGAMLPVTNIASSEPFWKDEYLQEYLRIVAAQRKMIAWHLPNVTLP
jgi:hypothetical protein